jgi:hypothetical protein
MPFAVRLRTKIHGAPAPHLQKWLHDALTAIPDVALSDHDPDFELFVGGGLLQPHGYDAPTLMLLGSAMRLYQVRNLIEGENGKPAPPLAEILPILEAPEDCYFMVQGGPPVNAREHCGALVRQFDQKTLQPARLRSEK